MLVDRSREKLINTIIFFATRTKYCGKMKLFRLLFLADFEHFKQTGRSVTGQEYYAYDFGPAPEPLNREWAAPKNDFKTALFVTPVSGVERESINVRTPFDDSHFSKREIRLLDQLADQYRDVALPDAIDVNRLENGAWPRVWNGGAGASRQIPFELALDAEAPNRDAILDIAKEYKAIQLTHV